MMWIFQDFPVTQILRLKSFLETLDVVKLFFFFFAILEAMSWLFRLVFGVGRFFST